jgi:DNA invertase Pin-like site-specific DNA recombinase
MRFMKRQRAISYIRMSTSEQRLGHSEQRQVEKSIEYAKRHNLDLLEQDQLKDIGVSGFTGAQLDAKLGLFLQAVRAGKVARGTYLLVENQDRLSRQEVATALHLFLEIINRGINVVIIDEDMVFSEKQS